ncbi:MAG TPA: glycosyltransferase family 87 protein [Syntrophorhabdaceae bacterium]|nr:glycosyltransferase family 87 protein [Syntrophorhabdaceae bacterium]
MKNTPVLLAVLLFASILVFFGHHNGRWKYEHQLNYTSDVLQGQSDQPMDILANIIGFRRMIQKANAYPIIGPAVRELGVNWNVRHPHTHPPPALLLVAPIAYLPLKLSMTVWAYLMLGCLFVSMLLYGFQWRLSLFISVLSLFWSPVILSLGQITLIWMLGMGVGFKYRNTNLSISGIGIGIASITKFLPVLALFPFLRKKRAAALIGCAVVWIVSLVIVTVLNQATLSDYFTANRGLAGHAAWRLDNASPLMGFYRMFGFSGLALPCLFIVSLCYLNRKDFFDPDQISARTFMFFSWLSVALLPIAWIYSLAPLLPVLLYFLIQRNLISTVLCLFIIALPNFNPPWGDKFVVVFYLCVLLTGSLFVLDRLPGKCFRSRYKAGSGKLFV